uniref:Variant surface glycoprotein 1125.2771 n=1 Tax=Trypanosoma brucei TaxID=5691 RepID=A0A1J0R8R4_9TRYP|nr:variant surface glycoprotein 1125.2771 [Trypanosoma brucei]
MQQHFQSGAGLSLEKPLLLAVALAIIFATQRTQTAKENAKEFKDLCKLYELLSAAILDPKLKKRSAADTLTSPSTRMTNIIEKIRKLNLTVLPSTVEKALRGQPPKGGGKKAKDNHEAVAYFGKNAKLAEIVTRIKTLTNDKKGPCKGRLKLPLLETTANKLRRAVAHLVAKAEELETQQQFLARELTDMRKKTRYHAFKALYGNTGLAGHTEQQMNPYEAIPLPGEASKFPWDNSKTQTQTCGAGSSPFATASKGACIDYGEMLYKKDGIPWVVEAKKAEAAAQGIPALFRAVEQIVSEVSAIESKLENLLLIGDLSNLAIATGDTKQGRKQPAAGDQHKCKTAKNKTAEGCASVGCDYDDSTSECKPKAGTANTAAGNTAATRVNCSDFKDQTSRDAAVGPVPAEKAKFFG